MATITNDVNLEEDILFNILGLFFRLDCNEIIFQSKKISFQEDILYLCYERWGDNQISIDIYGSKNNIFILINEIDERFNKADPYITSYAIIGSYIKEKETYILNTNLQHIDVSKIFEFMQENKNTDTSQFMKDGVDHINDYLNCVHILKRYNLKIQK